MQNNTKVQLWTKNTLLEKSGVGLELICMIVTNKQKETKKKSVFFSSFSLLAQSWDLN